MLKSFHSHEEEAQEQIACRMMVLCSDSPAKYPKFCSCVTLPGAREMPEGKEAGNSHFEMPAHSCWNITGYKVPSTCTATKTEHMEEEHVLCFLKYPTYARKDYRLQCAPPYYTTKTHPGLHTWVANTQHYNLGPFSTDSFSCHVP